MAKLTLKEFGLSVLLGAGVVIGIAVLSKLTFLTGLPLMSTNIWPGVITIGQALFGGVSALGMSLLIANFR